MSTEIGTPQHVVDALGVIAAHLREAGLAECEVSPAGGAAFRLTRRADELLAAWQAERDVMRAVAEAAVEVEAAHEAKAAALSLPTVLRDRKTDDARYQAINKADARLNKALFAYRAAVAALRAREGNQ